MSHAGVEKEFIQVVTFLLNGEEFGVNIMNVQEVIRVGSITHVPNSLNYIKGVFNLRGTILPVMDLRKRLGFPEAEPSRQQRVIVVEFSGNRIGFLVDQVKGVFTLPVSQIEASPSIQNVTVAQFISGLAKMDDRLIILLDLARLLSKEEKQEVAKIMEEEVENAGGDAP